MAHDRTIILALTGDLQLSHSLVRGAQDPAEETTRVYELLRRAKLTFANLETPLTRRGHTADKLIAFRADPALAGELAAIGVDVVTVANNHGLDYGLEGLRDTLAALNESGVASVGGGETVTEAMAPRMLEAADFVVAFLGFSCTLPAGFAASDDRPGIAPIRIFTRYVIDSDALLEQPGTAPYVETRSDAGDVERALAAVRLAREGADLVVVGIHWGVPHGFVAPFQDALAEYQRPLGHALVEAGADVVVGHHAHVLHGMEWYQGRLIFYSLGNFLFHRLAPGAPLGVTRDYPPYKWKSLRSRINRLSCLPLITVGSDGPRAVELVPLVLGDMGEPRTAAPDEAQEILALLDELSRPTGTRVEAAAERGRLLPSASSGASTERMQ